VCAAKIEKLNPMLKDSQGTIGVAEAPSVTAADIPRVGEHLKARQSVSGANGRVILTVDQLQQLHGELNIAQSSGTEFDLTIPLNVWNILGDTFAHSLHRLHEPRSA
jgi:NADPH-dependent curcumin reductase CurA